MTIDWGSAPDWIVAVTAIVAVVIARGQWSAARAAEQRSAVANEQSASAGERTLEIERAAMLRAIDAEFESAEMYSSRKAIRAFRNRIQEKMRADHREASEETITKRCAEEFSRQLTELWEVAKTFNDVDVDKPRSHQRIALDRYSELMRLVNWFETIGYMCKRGLLPIEDILNIYDAAVIPTMLYMAEHIHKRREERPYPNPRFMEFAMWLAEEAMAQMKHKSTLPDNVVANANLFEP